MSVTEPTSEVHIVLVTWLKSKWTRLAAAKDLYTSALFQKERAYAERVAKGHDKNDFFKFFERAFLR
jgi:hypothetical protein